MAIATPKTPSARQRPSGGSRLDFDGFFTDVFDLGPIDAKELATILQNEGLTCAATHLPIDRMINDADKVIEEHKLWGCKYTAIGGFFQKQFVTQDWLPLAAAAFAFSCR